jgi:hypothetical protein
MDSLENSAGFLGSMDELVDRTRIFFSQEAGPIAVYNPCCRISTYSKVQLNGLLTIIQYSGDLLR